MDPNEPPVKPDEPGKDTGAPQAAPPSAGVPALPAAGVLVPQAHGGALKRGGVARAKGVPNKATTSFRETVTKLLHANEKTISKWVDQVANGVPAVYDSEGKLKTPAVPPNPLGGLKAIAALAEFAAPRLSRQETVGEGGGPVTVVVRKEG